MAARSRKEEENARRIAEAEAAKKERKAVRLISHRPDGGARGVAELRDMCEELGISNGGFRDDLIKRIRTHQREKEAAAHAKKQERKDKTWEKGAKDTSKADASAASSAEAAERKAAAAAQVRVLVRLAAAAGGAGACVDAPGLATHPARSLAGPMSPGLAMTQG